MGFPEDIEMDCKTVNRLPNEMVSFNPSDVKSVKHLLAKYGPESLYEIANVLRSVALEDIENAIFDVNFNK